MAGFLYEKNGVLYRVEDGTTTAVIPFGKDSFHIICTKSGAVDISAKFALAKDDITESVKIIDKPVIELFDEIQHVVSNMPGEKTIKVPCGKITHGKITATFKAGGKLVFTNQNGEILLSEFARNLNDGASEDLSALKIDGRDFNQQKGDTYKITARFDADDNEKIYGMGQYQQPYLNLKGCTLELAQRNSQASVPFYLSNKGYGFLWNNPSVGEVSFSKNVTVWKSNCSKQLDYWITAGDTPADIEENYASVTGTVPMMPEYAMGFWQSKLRYRTQEEVLSIAREYKKRNLPLDVIVIDFFHWIHEGDWSFDETMFPDPKAMVDELESMGVKVMVSIWPTVEEKSVNYEKMRQLGYLMKTHKGYPFVNYFMVPTVHFDATNPDAREFVFDRVNNNYCKHGITNFWLDVAEPEFTSYDFEHFHYYAGSVEEVGNIYPVMYARTFFEGLKKNGCKEIISLIRCAWAGSQKYGALVWSGDIAPTFKAMRNQIAAGLNMAIAGIPWWTTDIGGFHGGDPRTEEYREVFARWFAWGAFCPVMRVHGDRAPRQEVLGNTPGSQCCSGGPNEVFSYGDEVYEICKKYLDIRVKLKPYIKKIMTDAHEKGSPVIRPMFYDFPKDNTCYEVEDQHMFGPDLLVCPVYEANCKTKRVYLPEGAMWRHTDTNEVYKGGQFVTVNTPLNSIPVFAKDDFALI